MLKIENLPSLKNIADVILSEGSSGQIILFCIPSHGVWEKWKENLLNALNNSLIEKGHRQVWDILTANTSSNNPQKDVAEFLDLEDDAELSDILASFGDESPIIIELLCAGELHQSWYSFINNVARFFRVEGASYVNRVICIFFINPPKLPPVKSDAGIRCYSFWNPLRWEEIRLVIQSSVSSENAMSRAWRVSTYTGISNSDPELISKLVEEAPSSLSEIKDIVKRDRSNARKKSSFKGSVNRFHEERSWDVPSGLTVEWLQNRLLGSTLDRGAIIPWHNIAESDLDSIFDRAIWREQLAGIFPLLMEITFFTSEIISKIKGKGWKKQILTQNDNGSPDTEPGTILNIFHEKQNEFGKLPKKIYSLLQELRIARNKLAHLEPVDFKDVNQIWSLFEQISKDYHRK